MINFNPQKERDAQSGTEWQFGAIETDIALVPVKDRLLFLPEGVLQGNSVMDTQGCASRAPLNILEAKLNWFYDNGMHPAIKSWCDEKGYRVNGKFKLCDAFIEILSGTTKTGNSLKAPVDTVRKYGVIPASLIPLGDNMTWDEYMNPSRVTEAHKELGKEFIRRLSIGYEQVQVSDFLNALQVDYLDVAGHAWPYPVNGVYLRTEEQFNHAFANLNPEIDVFDNYEPFIKRLAKDYKFFDWGYSMSITSQNPYPNETLTLFETLSKFGLLAFFAEAFRRLVAIETPPGLILPVVPYTPPTSGRRLFEAAESFIGRDSSPQDLAPDELGCAESVNEIYKSVFGEYICKEHLLSTYWMYKELKNPMKFEMVLDPKPGDIIMSPTGYTYSTSPVKNGHVGVVGVDNRIMSNNSQDGKWGYKYTLSTWKDYYGIKGGYPIIYFRVV